MGQPLADPLELFHGSSCLLEVIALKITGVILSRIRLRSHKEVTRLRGTKPNASWETWVRKDTPDNVRRDQVKGHLLALDSIFKLLHPR